MWRAVLKEAHADLIRIALPIDISPEQGNREMQCLCNHDLRLHKPGTYEAL